MDECRDTFVKREGDTGVYVADLFISDEPSGEHQNEAWNRRVEE